MKEMLHVHTNNHFIIKALLQIMTLLLHSLLPLFQKGKNRLLKKNKFFLIKILFIHNSKGSYPMINSVKDLDQKVFQNRKLKVKEIKTPFPLIICWCINRQITITIKNNFMVKLLPTRKDALFLNIAKFIRFNNFHRTNIRISTTPEQTSNFKKW